MNLKKLTILLFFKLITMMKGYNCYLIVFITKISYSLIINFLGGY